MNKIFDALEICLRELENGADVETVLARFPDLAGELRPILKTSLKARSLSAAEPSQEVVRRGRARIMQRAAEMRESRVAPRKRVIPAFQRLALSFTLAALLLLSSTGLLNASASALPGENLYPVKRTWEGLRLLLIFDKEARELLEHQFETERLHEVNELLVEGRHETIQIAGVFMQVNGRNYISGIPVNLAAAMQAPENGAAVIITGQTNAQGVVELITLELLPDGSVVPVGSPIEMELESESESGEEPASGSGPSSGSENEAPEIAPQFYAIDGTLQAMSTTNLVVNDLTVYLDNAQIKGELCIGVRVEVEGYFAADGRFIVTKVEAEGPCSTDSGGSGNGNSNTGDGSGGDDDHGNDNGGDGNDGGGAEDGGDDNTNGDDNNDNNDNNGNADNDDNDDNDNDNSNDNSNSNDNGNDNNDNG